MPVSQAQLLGGSCSEGSGGGFAGFLKSTKRSQGRTTFRNQFPNHSETIFCPPGSRIIAISPNQVSCICFARSARKFKRFRFERREILGDPHFAGTCPPFSVTGNSHEVNNHRAFDCPGKIGHENILVTVIEGHHVSIVEDIVDSGVTLTYLLNLLDQRKPRSIKIAALLDKPERRLRPVTAAYAGFSIPDEFVVGYGLDYAEKYRSLPDICVLSESE